MSLVTGVNEELLGSAEDDKSGLLSMLRQGAALTTLQGIFDKFDYSLKLYGSLRIQAIIKNFSKGKVARILGREPHEKFFFGASSKYDIAIEEGMYSTTQKQLAFKQLLYLKELGMPVPDSAIIKASSISDKKDLLDAMEQQAKQQQQAQQQATQVQMEQAQQQKMLDFAKTKADLAKADESRASAQQKLASIDETLSKAEHERTAADLDIVQKLIQLEDADRQGMMRALQFAEMIKATQQPQSLPGGANETKNNYG
jgi:thioester reductase-like protein